MTTFIIIIALAVVFFAAFKQLGKTKLKNASLGYDFNKMVKMGTYISGHPDLNESKSTVSIIPKDGKLDLLFTPKEIAIITPTLLASLDPTLIKDIVVEDQSSFEKRISLGRVALVGVFALIWKKKKKNELVYLIISWNDGRLDHETVFEFEGANSMNHANTARNSLIKMF